MRNENAGSAESYRLHLGAHPRAPKVVRVALKRNLTDWNLIHLFDDVALVATELVTNAMRLGCPFTLDLIREDRTVLVEVTDGSDAMPVVIDNSGDATAENGRGMFIVDLLAKEWGVRTAGRSKTVWARL
jgi:hypothetical protein